MNLVSFYAMRTLFTSQTDLESALVVGAAVTLGRSFPKRDSELLIERRNDLIQLIKTFSPEMWIDELLVYRGVLSDLALLYVKKNLV